MRAIKLKTCKAADGEFNIPKGAAINGLFECSEWELMYRQILLTLPRVSPLSPNKLVRILRMRGHVNSMTKTQ